MALTAALLAPASSLANGSGSISGTVTDAVSHNGLEDVEVCAFRASDLEYENCGYSDSSGHYTIVNLGTHEYKLHFQSYSETNYAPQYYNNKNTIEEGDNVAVTSGSDTPNINAQLHEGGHISGTVTDSVHHNPIQFIEVCANENGMQYLNRCSTTNVSGQYTINGLPTGEYTVEFKAENGEANWLTQYYNGKSENEYEEADPVSVTVGATTSGINASLSEGGKITGTVTNNTTHNGIQGVIVCAEGTPTYRCSNTNVSGQYTIGGLPDASYTVFFSTGEFDPPYFQQYYNGKSSFPEADDVVVGAGATVSNINAALQEGGKITGHVTDAGTSANIQGIEACAFVGEQGYVGCGETDINGNYTIIGLHTGSYQIRFRPSYYAGLNYITQWYNGKGIHNEATEVSATQGVTTPNINAQMHEGGKITGIVTDAISHNPVENLGVCVTPVSSQIETPECVGTGFNGHYTIEGLATGSYKVQFNRPYESEYASQYYSNKPSLSEATPVSVTAGGTTQNINAAMEIGGKISGTVTDASTHSAIEGIDVCIEGGPLEYYDECEYTDAAGKYEFKGLQTGSYHVAFYAGFVCSPTCTELNYVYQYYNNKHSSQESTQVSVTVAHTTSGINAQMVEGGKIKGTVTDAISHEAVESIEVCAFEPGVGEGSSFYQCGYSNEHGEYTIVGIPTGTAVVRFALGEFYSGPANYAPQYYNDKAKLSEATHVSTTAGATVSGINAAMHAGGVISGTVTNATTHNPIQNIGVCASESGEGEYFDCTGTNASGQYSIVGLPTGSYSVLFHDESSVYARQYYDGKGSAFTANSVSVSQGVTTPNVDAAMGLGGFINGIVTGADTHTGLANVEVCAVGLDNAEDLYYCEWTNSAGHYSIPQLPAGNYKIQFSPPYLSAYQGQFYNNQSRWALGGSVSVTASSTTSGINAELSKPGAKPVNTSLPEVTGNTSLGHTLFCENGSWENSPTSYSYVWLRGAEVISGATTGTLEVQVADQGHSVSCEVTATNGIGSATATSTGLAIPAAAGSPVNTVAPVLSGTPAVGQLLSCGNGSWEHSPSSFTYAWLRDSTIINGHTTGTYTVASADQGHAISCEVTAHNGSGAQSASSNTFQVPAAEGGGGNEGGGGGGGSGGGSSGGGGGTPPPAEPAPTPKPKPLTCKKGFKKKKIHGKFHCVKVKHKHHKG